MVECASLQHCPYAVPMYSLARNATVLVNQAPAIMSTGLMSLNKYAPSLYKRIIGQSFAILSGAGTGLTVRDGPVSSVPGWGQACVP